MDTPSLKLIEQSHWTPPASNWSNSHIGHSQPQTDHTVSVDTLQLQTDQTVPVDILNLGFIIHTGLLTTSDWLHIHIGPPTSYWGESRNASYNLRLIRYSPWTPPVSDWSESRSGHPTTSGWSNSHSGNPIHLNWSDIHSGHPHPRTDQAVSVTCNLRLIRQSQRTQHNLRLISRPGGHTKTSDWSDIHSRYLTTSDWSDSPTGHPTYWGWSEIHSWTPQPQTDQTVPMDTPSFSPCNMNNTIFMFELDSTRHSWSK